LTEGQARAAGAMLCGQAGRERSVGSGRGRKQAERGAGREWGTICMPARRDVAPPRSAFATRERRIEVITSLPFEDKRDILCFFRHIIGSAATDPAGRPINPGLFLNPATSPPGRPAYPSSSLYSTLYPNYV